jgi:hypothetical protein
LRQRRNIKSEAAELSAPVDPRIPTMPNPDKRKWHPLAKRWWKNVWQSPMASRYLETDLDALGMIAILIDDFYKAPTKELAGEIRLQTARFGLSNWDRNRMDWTVKVTSETAPRPQSPHSAGEDPRALLKVVH